MGSVGNSLIKGIDKQEIIKQLLSFYAYELSKRQWTNAVLIELKGMAAVILPSELQLQVKESDQIMQSLASRIGLLGGSIPANFSQINELSPIKDISIPEDTSDMGSILTYALKNTQTMIKLYAEFLDQIKDKDIVTYFQLVDILTKKIELEDEIETALNI